MVDRLTAAIEKARSSRADPSYDAAGASGPGASLPASTDVGWMDIPEAALDPSDLDEARIVPASRDSHQAAGLEILRARLVRLCRENGWKRIAFVPTSPGSGATTLALNLAMTAANRDDQRVLLADLDFASPSIARRLNLAGPVPLREVLEGACPPERAMRRLGPNLILLAGGSPVEPRTVPAVELKVRSLLAQVQSGLKPDLMFLDFPSIFSGGEAAALLAGVDAAFQIAEANRATAPEIDECAEVLAGSVAYLGVILNRCSGRSLRRFADVAG